MASTLKEKLQDVERKHMEELRVLQQDQDEQLDMMKQLHSKELEHHKSASNAVLGKSVKDSASCTMVGSYDLRHESS